MTMQRTIFVVIISACIVLGARTVSAATMTLTAPQATVPNDGLVTVDLRLDSEGATVNAVQATVHYDASLLEFVNVLPDQAFVSLWTEPPQLVAPGTVVMSGGKPIGAFLLDVPLVHLTFRAQQEGAAVISVDPGVSGVYLSDGYGTATPLSVKPLTLAISGPLHILAQPTSPSHPSESGWSPVRSFVVVWNTYTNYEVSFELSRDPLAVPDDMPDENSGTMTYPNLTDGSWYFTFKERMRGEGWGPVLRRVVRIDGTAPEPFAVVSTRDREGGNGLLSFAATDATSGIATYVVRITEKLWWNPWNASVRTLRANNVVPLGDPSNITQVDVTALDRAGNGRTERWYGEHPRRTQLMFMVSLLLAAAVLAGLLLTVVLFTRRVKRTSTRTTR